MALWPELADLEFTLGYVNAAGVRTRCLAAGAGEPLILLHGAGGHLETYVRNIKPLAAYYRVFAFDMLGHGYTDKPDYDYELPHYVRHTLDAMDALGVKCAHFSGESLGGWVAAKLAAAHPERVNRLVLNTAGGLTADPAVMDRLRTLSLKAVAEANRDNVRTRLEWLMHDKKMVTDDLVESRYRIYTQPGFLKAMEHIMCLQIMEIRRRSMLTDDELRAIEAPSLVIWTSHDPSGAVEVGERFARTIPDARLVVMQDCGHWPQFENAPLFNRMMLDFLAGREVEVAAAE
jgi:2-hydroxy-6-oxonona-2,4-dienedioate hydrolase